MCKLREWVSIVVHSRGSCKPAFAVVVIVYDTLLTLPHEIALVWRGRFRLAAILYFMTRYAGMTNAVALVAGSRSNLSLQVRHVFLGVSLRGC